MKRNHYLILGGIALVAGYLWYKKDKENKAKKALMLAPATASNSTMTEGEASNIEGTTCRCDNGFTGYCQSGDCSKCCGSYNKQPYKETRHYTFLKKQQQAKPNYATSMGMNY